MNSVNDNTEKYPQGLVSQPDGFSETSYEQRSQTVSCNTDGLTPTEEREAGYCPADRNIAAYDPYRTILYSVIREMGEVFRC